MSLCIGTSPNDSIKVVKVVYFIIFLLSSLFATSAVFASQVVLNELMPHPSPGNDWLEIYNPTSNSADLTDWTLVDSTSIMKTLSGTIGPNSFITFDVTNRLNNSGDNIYLKDSTGNIVDNYSYDSDPGINKSIGRNPDGGNWITLVNSSKGSSNIEQTLSSPSPTPSSPSSSPTPTTTPPPSATPKPTSIFTISNIPSQINANQSFNVSINLLLPNNLNTVYYLAGAFKKVDGTRYFGLTKNINNWIKYGDPAATQYQITTNSSGSWTGTLEVKPDTSDSDYKGSGDYLFKVGRYTSSSSSPVWSNEIALKINDTDTSSNTSTPQPTSINNLEASPLPTKLLPPRSKPTQLKSFYQIASVAAATTSAQPATSSAQVNIKNKSQINPLILAGLVLIFAGVSLIGYIYIRKNAKIPI